MKWQKINFLNTAFRNKHLKTTTYILALILLLSFFLVAPTIAKPRKLQPGVDFSGFHFNLNIHGVPEGVEKPVPDDSGPGRHSVFMPIVSDNDTNVRFFYKVEGLNWTVDDCDATDSDHMINITLPRTIYNETDDTLIGHVDYYMVYLVALGKPSDSDFILYPQAIFDNATSGKVYYEWDKLDVPGHGKGKKGGGQPQWVNATDWFFLDIELINQTNQYLNTTIVYEDEWCFNIPYLDDYWWKVNNEGIKHIQVRFYPVFKANGRK